ncbi:MAG: nucleotide exchange factor GrpE [Flavobacteriales bacterium]
MTKEVKTKKDEKEASKKTKKQKVAKKSSKEEITELKDKHLRLFAEFENFKKRTAKERIELYKTAGENVLSAILPILDDFERAIKSGSVNESEKEGIGLIYNKLKNTLESKGLKEIEDPVGKELNTDFHEAITNIPAPSEELKGKIVDVIEKGYYLNEKVIRYSKVVVANNE